MKKVKKRHYGKAVKAMNAILKDGKSSKKAKKRYKQAKKRLRQLVRQAAAGGQKKLKAVKKKKTGGKKSAGKAKSGKAAASNIAAKSKPKDSAKKVKKSAKKPAAEVAVAIGMAEPRDGGRDDLKKISGIGPKTESTLHGLGIFHFDQIAAWTQEHIQMVEDQLSYSGWIKRKDWIAQARALLKGGRDK